MLTVNYVWVNSAVSTIKVWLGNVTITSTMDPVLDPSECTTLTTT